MGVGEWREAKTLVDEQSRGGEQGKRAKSGWNWQFMAGNPG